MEGTAVAVTVHQSHHDLLFRFLFGEGAVLFLAANEGLIRLDNLVFAADRSSLYGLQSFAKAMAHEPRRTIGAEAKHALQLKGAHSLFGRHHEMRRHQPLM